MPTRGPGGSVMVKEDPEGPRATPQHSEAGMRGKMRDLRYARAS
jgi:hypothetical protein